MIKITVFAPSGSCPRKNGDVITTLPVSVPNNRYYRRLIADGSLTKSTVDFASIKQIKRKQEVTSDTK
jgi:hypothetical protein